MTAVGVASLLVTLGVLCLSLVAARSRAQSHEQRALQATWNARAGLEHFLQQGAVPEGNLALDPEDPQQSCSVIRSPNGDLVFVGLSHGVRRQLTCLGGDPARLTEEP